MRNFYLLFIFTIGLPLLIGGCGSSLGTGDGSGLISGSGAESMQELVPTNVVTGSLANIGGNAYFLRVDLESGVEPWISDGTLSGTRRIMDIYQGPDCCRRVNPNFTEFGGFVFFFFDDGFVGEELWRTDGTEAGTELVADLLSGSTFSSSSGSMLSASNEKLFMSTWGGVAVLELSDVQDGTPVFMPGPFQSPPDSMVNFDGMAYYFGYEGDFGYEPYVSDGTVEGTRRIMDIYQGPESSMKETTAFDPIFVEFGGPVYFAAYDGIVGRELWRTDGTEAGTELFADLVPGPGGIHSASVRASEDRLYLITEALGGVQFWAIELPDGEGAESVTELTPTNDRISALENINGVAYFILDHPDFGSEPWTSDGTAQGTALLKDIVPGPGSGGIIHRGATPPFVAFDGAVFFFADDGVVGTELWRTDGTEEGTALYADLVPGPDGFSPEILAVSDERLYITGSGPDFSGQLWVIEASP